MILYTKYLKQGNVSGIKDDICLWSLRYDINRHGIIPLINQGSRVRHFQSRQWNRFACDWGIDRVLTGGEDAQFATNLHLLSNSVHGVLVIPSFLGFFQKRGVWIDLA
jgi:hypothetical protein